MIRKFFNIDSPEAATGGDTSIAALMARQGVKNDSEQMVATPIVINTEKKEEPTTANEPTPAATALVDSPAEPANPETPSPTQEPAPAAPQPPIAAAPAPQAPTWQEVLKNQQPDTVLKELLGDDKVVSLAKRLKDVDPKMVAFLDKWQNKEDLTSYLREMTTDYSKMSAEDVMRHQLRQDYPKASPQQLDVIFNREVVKAYSLDSEDETELNEGKLFLEAKAEKYRDALIQKQSEYLLPAAPEPKQPEADPEVEAAQRRVEHFHNAIKSDPYTQAIYSSKQISFGEGEEKYNHPVNPEALTEVLLNDSKWAEKLFHVSVSPSGEKSYAPNVQKQFLIAAIMNDDNFLNGFADHYKSIGAKATVLPIENAKMPDGSSPAASEAPPRTAAEAMARMGRLV